MANTEKILLIEDEKPIRKFLSAGFSESDYQLIEAERGEEGLRLAASHLPALILLDLGLPDLDGLEVIKRLREWTQVPIIVLSARGQEEDKIRALDNGANDYLTKPFSMGELLARIRVALRPNTKSGEETGGIFESGSLKINFPTRQVFSSGNEIHLTPLEYKLLCLLVQNAGKVLTHRHLLTEVWGPSHARETHYLRVFMKQLRHKLEADPAQPEFLTTESGVGYRFRTRN